MAAMASCGCFAPQCLHNKVQFWYASSGASSYSCQYVPSSSYRSVKRRCSVGIKAGSWKVQATGGRDSGGKTRQEMELEEEVLMTVELRRLLEEPHQAREMELYSGCKSSEARRKAVVRPQERMLKVEEEEKTRGRSEIVPPVTMRRAKNTSAPAKHLLLRKPSGVDSSPEKPAEEGCDEELFSFHEDEASSSNECSVTTSVAEAALAEFLVASQTSSVESNTTSCADGESLGLVGAAIPRSSVSPDAPREVKRLCKEGRFEEALQLMQSIDPQQKQVFSTACVRLLQRCTKLRLLADGRLVHAHIMNVGFTPDVFLGTTLVCMYAKCGSIQEARKVFDSLTERNSITWTMLIEGYVKHQQSSEALKLFSLMRAEELEGDKYTYVSILNACASLQSLKDGEEVHALVVSSGLHSELYVANSLVDMYAKCGSIDKAREVFDAMGKRDVVSWNVMIGAYAREGLNDEALALFDEMHKQRLKPDPISFVNLINTCVSLDFVKKVHNQVEQCRFDTDVFVQTALLTAYTKSGSIEDARKVFDKMSSRDTISWNAMLGGYVQLGHGVEALKLFIRMQSEGLSPDKFTFVHIINACSSFVSAEQGKRVHSLAVKAGYEADVFVGTTLIGMYVKQRNMDAALQVFNKLPIRDVVTWNTVIGGLMQQGRAEEALDIFQKMLDEGGEADKVTLCTVIKACAKLESLERGRQVHGRIIGTLYETDVYVGTGLVSMYAKCGSLFEARQVFERMTERNVVTWTAFINGHVQHGLHVEALELYKQMLGVGVQPNEVTLVSVLNACTNLLNLEEAKQVHSYINKKGMQLDHFLGTALVNMYAKCGCMEEAREAFVQMSGHSSVICWTALISGYVHAGRSKEALRLFWQMQREGVKPNEVTFTSVLSVCYRPSELEEGRRIHAFIMSNGCDTDLFVGTALLTMYGKCGSIVQARQVFDRMPQHNVVSWTAMIGAYVYARLDDEAFTLFRQMQASGVKPNERTYVSVLEACGNLGVLEDGKQIHATIIRGGFMSDVSVGNSLIEMYSKCGSVADARLVFDDMTVKTVRTWNAMMKGYALNGHFNAAFALFEEMEIRGVTENSATFGCILKACGIAGALQEGIQVHKRINDSGYDGEQFISNSLISMYVKCSSLLDAQKVFDTMPKRNVDSWSAILAGYAQANLASEALKLFLQMEMEDVKPNHEVFIHLIQACANAGDLSVGKQMHAEVIRTGYEKHALVGRSLVDMYTRCGSLEDAAAISFRVVYT